MVNAFLPSSLCAQLFDLIIAFVLNQQHPFATLSSIFQHDLLVSMVSRFPSLAFHSVDPRSIYAYGNNYGRNIFTQGLFLTVHIEKDTAGICNACSRSLDTEREMRRGRRERRRREGNSTRI